MAGHISYGPSKAMRGFQGDASVRTSLLMAHLSLCTPIVCPRAGLTGSCTSAFMPTHVSMHTSMPASHACLASCPHENQHAYIVMAYIVMAYIVIACI